MILIPIGRDGIGELKTNGLKAKALAIGDSIPDIALIDQEGHPVALKDFMQWDYLVLNFYRGGWCPYCNLELRAYEQLRSQFQAINADIVAISPERPHFTARTSDKNAISYPILTDLDGKLISELGIGFRLSNDLKREYLNFGIDLHHLHGNSKDELVVPAIYVIDRDMTITMVHLDENYMNRIEPQEVLTQLAAKQSLSYYSGLS